VSTFPLIKPCMSLYFLFVFVEFDMNSPLLFPPHPLVCSKVLLRRRTKMSWSFLEAYQKCLTYGASSQPSLRRMEPEKKFSNPFHDTLIVVSVIINIFSAIYITLFLIFLFFCCMCGLPRHTYDDSSFLLKTKVL